MEETKRKSVPERLYLDTLNGVEAFLEIDWNRPSTRQDLIRICVKKDLDHLENFDEAILKREDLETVLLALSSNPFRFLRSTTKKVGIKYVPVPQREYQEYMEHKQRKQKYAKS